MKPSAAPDNSIETRSAIWRMYRDAADEDYLVARIAARTGLDYQFWWNAQQAVEKYLKASLLLNGHDVKQYGHKLLPMYEKLVGYCGNLLPYLHCPPRNVEVKFWPHPNSRSFCKVSTFVETLQANGDPNNRYRMSSIVTKSKYLIYLDELCFCLRRVAYPLDMNYDETAKTAREVLQCNREIQLHPKLSFESDFVVAGEAKSARAEAFEWCNFAYFPEESVARGEYPAFGKAVNAAPYMLLKGATPERLDAIEWIASRAFPTGIRKEVIKLVEQSRKALEK